jgi:hypothetical protein
MIFFFTNDIFFTKKYKKSYIYIIKFIKKNLTNDIFFTNDFYKNHIKNHTINCGSFQQAKVNNVLLD